MTPRRRVLAILALVLAATPRGVRRRRRDAGGHRRADAASRPRHPPARPPRAARPPSLTIFGAASLAKVLDEVKADYEAANPGTTLTISTDSSAALATQIEQGAPADVFLSADTTNPQKLVDAGLADGDAVVFAANKLTIITPTGQPGRPDRAVRPRPRRGSGSSRRGDEVPITKYATQLVENLAGAAGAPADFAAAYAANIVSKEENVAAVRTKIELGEGDARHRLRDGCRRPPTRSPRSTVPDDVNVPASYAGVVVKASPNVEAAHAFLDWFAGPDGQAILASFGFLPPAVMTNAVGERAAPIAGGASPRASRATFLGRRRAAGPRGRLRAVPGAARHHARRPVGRRRLPARDPRLVGGPRGARR